VSARIINTVIGKERIDFSDLSETATAGRMSDHRPPADQGDSRGTSNG
jgi:hypothetical protein